MRSCTKSLESSQRHFWSSLIPVYTSFVLRRSRRRLHLAGSCLSERVLCGTPVALIHAELLLHDVGHSAVNNCDAAFATSEYKTALVTHYNATELFLPSIRPEMWTFAVCTHACCLLVTVCPSVHAECERSIFQFVAFKVLSRFSRAHACPPSRIGFFSWSRVPECFTIQGLSRW